MRIILLGAPGSGKGTQARVLVEKFSVPHISTGELLRAEMASGSALGKKISDGMDSGEFVPNEVVMEMIENRLRQSDTRRGFILDGFPRNIPQAQALDSTLALMGRSLQLALYISVEHDQIVRRLTGRLTCASCGAVYNQHFSKPKKRGICDNCESDQLERRPDDSKKIIASRVATFQKETEPLIAYYRAQHKLRTVNGEEKIATISEKIIDIINAEIRPLDIKVVDVPVEDVYVSDSNTMIAGGAVVKTETDNAAKRNVPQSRTIEKVKENKSEKITRKKRGRKKAVVETATPTQSENKGVRGKKEPVTNKEKPGRKAGKKVTKKTTAKKSGKKAAKKAAAKKKKTTARKTAVKKISARKKIGKKKPARKTTKKANRKKVPSKKKATTRKKASKKPAKKKMTKKKVTKKMAKKPPKKKAKKKTRRR